MSNHKTMLLLSRLSDGVIARSSSVLQRNTKLYGPKNALDYENTLSSWNSNGGDEETTSWYSVDFGNRKVRPKEIRIQFQAGFSAEIMTVWAQQGSSDEWKQLEEFEDVEDAHELQTFDLDSSSCRALKFVFDECKDFYDRVIIYQLQVWGDEGDQAA